MEDPNVLSYKFLQEYAIMFKNIMATQVQHNVDLGKQIQELMAQIEPAQKTIDQMEASKLSPIQRKLGKILAILWKI